MSQKHDKGVQKRKRRAEGTAKASTVNGGRLARQLVSRGLASSLILDGYGPRSKDTDS